MKSLRASTLRNRKYWLLLCLPLVAASLMWSSAASASCNFLSILASIGSGDGLLKTIMCFTPKEFSEIERGLPYH